MELSLDIPDSCKVELVTGLEVNRVSGIAIKGAVSWPNVVVAAGDNERRGKRFDTVAMHASSAPSVTLDIDVKMVTTSVEPTGISCATLIALSMPEKETERFSDSPGGGVQRGSSPAVRVGALVSHLTVNLTVCSSHALVHLRTRKGQPLKVCFLACACAYDTARLS